jgi:hypothetical protein
MLAVCLIRKTSKNLRAARCWPDFGLAMTPSAAKHCAAWSSAPAGQRRPSWEQCPQISTDLKAGDSSPSEPDSCR